jgi:DNA primase
LDFTKYMSKSYNISKLLKKYNLPYRMSGAGKEVMLNCLWHDDFKHKLSVNTVTGAWQCWVCRETGSFRDLVKKIGLLKKTRIDLADFKGTYVKKAPTVHSSDEVKIPWPEAYQPLDEAKSPAMIFARNYVLKRGISEEQIAYYKIGYCQTGRYGGRIIVPVLDAREELVSFIARDCTGKLQPKVLTPPSLEGRHGIKDYVFNLHRAAVTGHLLIGEGVFDAISLGTRGVCLFGKTAAPIQIAKIVTKKPQRVTVCLDPDAQLEANILANQLIAHIPDVRIVTLPAGTDPNSVSPEELKLAIANAKPPVMGYSMDFIGV